MNIKPGIKILTPEQEAFMYSEIAWEGKMVDEQSIKNYANVKNYGNAVYSIDVARDLVNKNQARLNSKDKTVVYDTIIEILSTIHNNWVVENAKKYNRDAEKQDKRLFQHLPIELIGMEEAAKDLLFLAPFLQRMGIDCGYMENNGGGNFVPSKLIVNAFNRRVEKYKNTNNIKNKDTLAQHIVNTIDTYPSLQGIGISEDRRNYMKDRVSLLVAQTIKVNSKLLNYGISM